MCRRLPGQIPNSLVCCRCPPFACSGRGALRTTTETLPDFNRKRLPYQHRSPEPQPKLARTLTEVSRTPTESEVRAAARNNGPAWSTRPARQYQTVSTLIQQQANAALEKKQKSWIQHTQLNISWQNARSQFCENLRAGPSGWDWSASTPARSCPRTGSSPTPWPIEDIAEDVFRGRLHQEFVLCSLRIRPVIGVDIARR